MTTGDPTETELLLAAAAEGVQRFVVGGVIVRAGRLLLLRRLANDFMGGLCEVPGGEVEAGESLADALARECLEETGCPLREVHRRLPGFDYRSRSGTLTRQFNFLLGLAHGPIRLHEHDAYFWVARHELDDYPVSPELRGVLVAAWEPAARAAE